MNRKQLEKLSDSELRAALAQARKNRGYKMREMAALMGISLSAYSYTETIGRPLKPSNRERLIEMLQGEDLTSPERNDVRAVRVIDSAMAPLTKKERGRVTKYMVDKYTE